MSKGLHGNDAPPAVVCTTYHFTTAVCRMRARILRRNFVTGQVLYSGAMQSTQGQPRTLPATPLPQRPKLAQCVANHGVIQGSPGQALSEVCVEMGTFYQPQCCSIRFSGSTGSDCAQTLFTVTKAFPECGCR